MIISVASGKGGTGKTTVAINLALSLREAQFIDCDVEEPNANIFVKAEIYETTSVTVDTPTIDLDRCNFCGKCADFCMYNALAVVPKNVLVFPELCHSCGGCAIVCPKEAVSWKTRVIGKIDHGSLNRHIDFYQGVLNVGEAVAIPLLKALKKKINMDKTVILDASPGTACPVIETVKDSDYCILVTEPTPFGLHDLKLAVKTISHLHIPFGVIINRDGIGNAQVERYCQGNRIPILLKIPHQEEIARLYSQGIPLVERQPEWCELFKKLFDRLHRGIST